MAKANYSYTQMIDHVKNIRVLQRQCLKQHINNQTKMNNLKLKRNLLKEEHETLMVKLRLVFVGCYICILVFILLA